MRKAFDKVGHEAIIQILKHKGFSDKWVGWMHSLLNSGESYVLLNDIPDKPFLCKRGVRQGDPLSPLLFVLTADLLQSIVNNAWSRGILKHPIDEPFGGDYPIVQYADDTLLILPADGRILFNLKCLLSVRKVTNK